jgi:hypothetical protein
MPFGLSESRIREAMALNGVEALVVACPKDVTMYRDAVKTTGYESRLQVKDLIDISKSEIAGTSFRVERHPFQVEWTPFQVERTPFQVERTPFQVERTPFQVEWASFQVEWTPFRVE